MCCSSIHLSQIVDNSSGLVLTVSHVKMVLHFTNDKCPDDSDICLINKCVVKTQTKMTCVELDICYVMYESLRINSLNHDISTF